MGLLVNIYIYICLFSGTQNVSGLLSSSMDVAHRYLGVRTNTILLEDLEMGFFGSSSFEPVLEY